MICLINGYNSKITGYYLNNHKRLKSFCQNILKKIHAKQPFAKAFVYLPDNTNSSDITNKSQHVSLLPLFPRKPENSQFSFFHLTVTPLPRI